MAKASEGIVSPKAFSTAKADAGGLTAALKPLTDALNNATAAGVKVGDGVSTGARKAKAEVSPLTKDIASLKNEVAALRNTTEALDRPLNENVADFNRLKTASLELADGLARDSKEYRDLTGVAATAARSIKTLEGETTRLGLSGNVAVANTRNLAGGLNSLQGAVGPLLGAVGIGGLVTVTADLAKQADTTRVAQEVLSATITRTGQDAGAVQEAISNTADALKLTDAQVADSAATLLRLGLNAEQIEAGLISAGSSALAFGTTSAQGIESFTSALATGNSAALNTIGIAENIGKVMNEAADAHAGQGDAAIKAASATAGLNVVLAATESEVELLSTLTGGLAGKQADAARAAFEARQAFGEVLIPLETLRNEALAGVLGQFTEMPQATQASVLGIGGVTGGVTVLTAGMVGLRAAMLPLFAPPTGLIIAGVAATAALATGLYQFKKASDEAADGTAALKASQSALGDSGYLEHLTTAKEAVTELTEATDKEGLTKALTTYADTLDGSSQSALQTFIATTLTATLGQGEYQKAVDLSIGKLLELELAARKAESEQNYLLINTNATALSGLQTQIDNLETRRDSLFKGVAGAIRKAAPGLDEQALIAGYNEEIARLTGNYDSLSESNELLRRENEQVNISYVRLLEIQADVQNGTLTSAEAAQELIGSLSDGAAAATAFASGLGDTGAASTNAGNSLSTAGTAAKDTATYFERALTATEDYAFMLSQGVQQGVRPMEGALNLLTTALERQETIQANLAREGKFGANYQLAAEKARVLEAAIAEVADTQAEAIDAASDYSTSLDNLREMSLRTADAQAEAQARNAQAAKDLVAAQKEIRNAVASYDTDGTDALTEALERAVTQSGYMTDAQAELNLELRGSDSSAESLSDTLAALNEEGRRAGEYFQGGSSSAEDFSDSLAALNAEAAEANTRVRESAGGAENFSDSLDTLNRKAFAAANGLGRYGEAAEDSGEAAQEAATITISLSDALGVVTDGVGALGGALGAGTDDLELFEQGMGAIGKLASGDILGALVDTVNFVGNAYAEQADDFATYASAAEQYGQDVADAFTQTGAFGAFQFDEEGFAEYAAEAEQYLSAVEEYGQDVADTFVTIGENGEFAFNEAALEQYALGLERIEQNAEDLNQTLKEIESGYDSVQEAEISAGESALETKLETQGGEYTLEDIYAEQTLAIGRAAQERDQAYREAAELDAQGQHELADRRRAAADSAYRSEVQGIEQNAANQLNAIGQASQENIQGIRNNTAQSGEAWTGYWNEDARAQIEAMRYAREQERRVRAVMDSDLYAELLNSGLSEQEAYQQAAAGVGYGIDQTTGDLLTLEEQAGTTRQNSIQGNAAAVIASIFNATTQQEAAYGQQGARLSVAGGGAYSGLAAALGASSAALLGQISGNLSSEVASITGRGTALSNAIWNSANFLAGTAVSAGNHEKNAAFLAAQAKLKQDAANTNALVKLQAVGANLQSKTLAAAANLVAGQTIQGGKVSISAQVASANGQLKQIKLGADGLGKGLAGSGNFLSRIVVQADNAKAKAIINGAKAAVSAFHSGYLAQATQVILGANAVKTAIVSGALSKLKKVDLSGAIAVATGQISAGSFNIGGISQATIDGVIKANASQLGYGALPTPNLDEVDDLKGGSGKGGGGSGKGSGGSSKGGSGKGGSSKGGSSGGKKDGSTYTGGKSDSYPVGSPGWYQAKMQEIEEQIKKTSSPAQIRSLQAKKEKLQAELDKLLGKAESETAGAASGSINALQESIRDEQERFDSAATDKARAESAARLKILKDELEKKQAVLKDAEQAAASGKQNVITIESPIANLDGIIKQAKAAVLRAEDGSVVKPGFYDKVRAEDGSFVPKSFYGSTSAGASSRVMATAQAAPLPAYAAQQEMMNVPLYNTATIRFDNSTIRFDKSMDRLEALFGRQGNSIAQKLRGQGVSGFTL